MCCMRLNIVFIAVVDCLFVPQLLEAAKDGDLLTVRRLVGKDKVDFNCQNEVANIQQILILQTHILLLFVLYMVFL